MRIKRLRQMFLVLHVASDMVESVVGRPTNATLVEMLVT